MDLNQQAQEILKIAEQHGVEQNFFFITTFKRYQVQINILVDLENAIKRDQVQINILNDLEKSIKTDGTLVTKEYVKGRQNVYTHPAITEYNKTANGANQTVQTLMKIITTLRDESGNDAEDLIAFIRGG